MKSIGCLVTGHGEVEALPVLIRRVMAALGEYAVRVGEVWRLPESSLLKPGSDTLERQIDRLRRRSDAILVLLDLEDDCPAEVGPALQSRASAACGDKPCKVVCAYRELETWFIWDADNLWSIAPLPNPESRRDAKGWIRDHALPAYNEVEDGPGLCSRLGLEHVYAHSDSFRVLFDRLEAIVLELT